MTMNERMEVAFSPCLTLYWKGRFGRSTPHWHYDLVGDRNLLLQFMSEANIFTGNGACVRMEDLDAVIGAASNHGYCIETIDITDTWEESTDGTTDATQTHAG